MFVCAFRCAQVRKIELLSRELSNDLDLNFYTQSSHEGIECTIAKREAQVLLSNLYNVPVKVAGMFFTLSISAFATFGRQIGWIVNENITGLSISIKATSKYTCDCV